MPAPSPEFGSAAGGAAVVEVVQGGQRPGHDIVRELRRLSIGDEGDAAGVLLVRRVVEAGRLAGPGPRERRGRNHGLCRPDVSFPAGRRHGQNSCRRLVGYQMLTVRDGAGPAAEECRRERRPLGYAKVTAHDYDHWTNPAQDLKAVKVSTG